MPFHLLKSKLRYCNPFRNGNATIKIGPQKKADFATLVGDQSIRFWDTGSRSRSLQK